MAEDVERTMQTYLGACIELGPDDVDPQIIESSQITYLEGYLWDPQQAKEALSSGAALQTTINFKAGATT